MLATGRADEHAPGHVGDESVRSDEHAPGHVEAVERYLVQVTIDKSTQERLLYAQALLGHAVPAGDLGQVFRRALEALITQLEKRRIGGVKPRRRSSTLRPGTISRPRARYIPAKIRRAVWERDKGQCTFRSTAGRRCNERRFVEFDHAEPVARGGRATVEGMRLRCRTHNQYEAERAFGSDFMRLKREEASRKRHENVRLPARPPQVKDELTQDVLAGLRGLGCRGEEARRAAQFSASLESGTLEERMRAALGFVARRSRAHAPVT
jgi:hypothetical protein